MDKRSILLTIAFTLLMMGIILWTRYAQMHYPPPTVATPAPAPSSTTRPGPRRRERLEPIRQRGKR